MINIQLPNPHCCEINHDKTDIYLWVSSFKLWSVWYNWYLYLCGCQTEVISYNIHTPVWYGQFIIFSCIIQGVFQSPYSLMEQEKMSKTKIHSFYPWGEGVLRGIVNSTNIINFYNYDFPNLFTIKKGYTRFRL